MLYSLLSFKRVTSIPYPADYKRWRKRLPDEDYSAIIAELTSRIEGTEIQTSSWIPGRNWAGTIFEPIYSKACNENYREAAQFFGLLLWETILHHPNCWAFGRYELDGVPINGLTYFRLDSNPCIAK